MKRTPMHYAAHHGHPHLCALLHGWSAQVNVRDQYHRTPLAYAAINGDALVIKRLIDEGADSKVVPPKYQPL